MEISVGKRPVQVLSAAAANRTKAVNLKRSRGHRDTNFIPKQLSGPKQERNKAAWSTPDWGNVNANTGKSKVPVHLSALLPNTSTF